MLGLFPRPCPIFFDLFFICVLYQAKEPAGQRKSLLQKTPSESEEDDETPVHQPTPSKKRVREAYHAQRNRADQAERELNAAQKKLRQMKTILKARQFREVEGLVEEV